MKNCFGIKLGQFDLAIADIVPYNRSESIWLITRINVPSRFRGYGYGSQLLKMIIEEANKNNIKLYLEIQSSNGLDYDQLLAWYKRYGFIETKYFGVLQKKPQQSEDLSKST